MKMNDESNEPKRGMMNGKPVLYRQNTGTVISDPSPEFGEKLLCDSLVFNLGDACAFSCTYCYVKAVAWRFTKHVLDAHNEEAREADGCHRNRDFHEVVIRRGGAMDVLKAKLLRRDGTPRYPDPHDKRVIFSSTLVDVAANMDLLRETAAACRLILEHTAWHIRLLSKSSLLAQIVGMIPKCYKERLILGFSTGTVDERTCRAIEPGTANIKSRIKALHWLQDEGFRTYGMICPSLPQEDYDAFSSEVCDRIRVDRCEHVWAEPINIRREAMPRTLQGLRAEGLLREAELLESVHGPGTKGAWEDYARSTYLAHAANIPADKLRFLQYVTAGSAQWWAPMQSKGAVLLGEQARHLGICGG